VQLVVEKADRNGNPHDPPYRTGVVAKALRGEMPPPYHYFARYRQIGRTGLAKAGLPGRLPGKTDHSGPAGRR
jgi:hypothetical protein